MTKPARRLGCIAAAALLSACAHGPPPMLADEFGAPSERRVFVALRESEAKDEQRRAILAAYDEFEPKLRELAERREALLEQWRRLDRRNPTFLQQTDLVSAQLAAASVERMTLTASFEVRVATALDAEQWQAWQEYWRSPEFGPEMGGPGRMRGGGRRPR